MLDAVDEALARSTKEPAERAKQAADLMGETSLHLRRVRQRAVQEMKDGGMTLREIGDELKISFGRVRQILAEDLSDPDETRDE